MKNSNKSRKSRKNSGKQEASSPRTPILHGLKSETKRMVASIVLVTCAIVAALSLVGIAGPLGVWITKAVTLLFGVAGYLLPIALAFAAFWVSKKEQIDEENEEEIDSRPVGRVLIGLVITWLGLSGLLHILIAGDQSLWETASAGNGGGFVGALSATVFFSLLGKWAAALILSAISVIGFLISANWSPKKKASTAQPAQSNPIQAPISSFITNKLKPSPEAPKLVKKETQDNEEEEVITPSRAETLGFQPNPQTKVHEDWKLPSPDLLDGKLSESDNGNVQAGAQIIFQTLKNFNIDVEMGEVNQGPTVTQYTLRPATGVKLSQIAALKNDITLALAAKSLRMELPIPGQALVGIEVPNRTVGIVRLRSMVESTEFINHKSPLAFALGADVAGEPQIADLTKLPHLLIAGATGSGKSVAINTFIISLLYRNSPRMTKLILIDPKRVELTLYHGLPHLLTSPITEPDKAVNSLRWAVAEMDRRYETLSKAGKRNINEYNSVAGEALPYIVIIVDEMADLMAVAGRELEGVIARLAQMARAVGIHLVLATQRPSVDILTGLIKANITARMAFAVPSQIDSRTILDTAGAEQLLGNGDMLFISADQAKPRRIQGAFVAEPEVRKVVDFCKRQVGAVIYDDSVVQKKPAGSGMPGASDALEEEDSLLEEAKQEVIRAGKASASLLQRRLRIGYSRAARLLDLLESAGVVGPQDGAKPREVYGSENLTSQFDGPEDDPDNSYTGPQPNNHEN